MNEEEYETKIAELEQQLKEAQENNQNNDDFSEIKEKYEKIIEEKNTEINELQNEVKNTQKSVNDTVDKLNDEIQARLDANEQYQKMLATVEELEKEKAEATVDTLIKQGKLVPAQKEMALEFCLNDADKFLDLYRDAKPIVETEPKRKSIPSGTAERIAQFFTN